MIDKFTEQKIKDAANIVDVIGDFLELRRKGSNYETLCPFHNDRHLGSFVVYPRGNCYKCFSCDAKGGSVDFLMDYAHMTYPDALRYLAQKYGIFIDEDNGKKFENVKPAQPRSIEDCIPEDLPKRLWPIAWVKHYKDIDNDNLVRWLRSQPWDGCQRLRLEQNLKDYLVGHASIDWKDERHEFTVFWEVDEQNKLHNGHLMKYLPTGKRDKTEDSYTQTWLHARMRYTHHPMRFDDRLNSASYCLFGQHLLNRYPNATVNIVESEKTALIMATAYGNHEGDVWMACCGMQNLNRERLGVLIAKGRRIVLWPDRDGIDRWKTKANEIGYDRLSINTKMVLDWWKPEDGEKADCGDVVLRILHEARQPQPVGEVLREVIANNPAMAALNDKFGLKVIKEDGTAGNT